MNKRKVALGPGAASLILIVVILSLCMLAMLTTIGSRNDYSLASRSAEMITRVYDLQGQTERKMAELDAVLVKCQKDAGSMEAYLEQVGKNLPEGMEINGDLVSWTEPLDNRTMNCEVRILEMGKLPRAEWVNYRLKVDEPEDDWEW